MLLLLHAYYNDDDDDDNHTCINNNNENEMYYQLYDLTGEIFIHFLYSSHFGTKNFLLEFVNWLTHSPFTSLSFSFKNKSAYTWMHVKLMYFNLKKKTNGNGQYSTLILFCCFFLSSNRQLHSVDVPICLEFSRHI